MVTQSSDELMKLKKADLVAIAKEKDLSTAGSKSELVKRIIALTFDEDLVPEQEEELEPENAIQLDIESEVEPTDNDESSDVVEEIEPPVHRVFTELPKRSFIAGGHHAKPFIATLIVTFVLIFSYGFQDYYRENFYFEGIGAKDGLDCIYTFEHEGNGNHTDYNPEHQDNIDCADIFTKAGYTWYTANYWQENMDEWLQSILAAAQSGGGDENSSGFIWTQVGIDTMAYLGATTFSQNMSVYGDPVAGDEFTGEHLAIWNGFTLAMGGGNDTFESLLPGGNSPFAVYMPAGIVGNAPTGYVWTQVGIYTMAYLGATTFNQNMSVFDYPITGDVFTNGNLAVWNGFTATFPGGGNDTFDGLLPGGNSPFAIYMPAGIVITTVEWFNQTPIVSNVTITENTSENVTTFSCDYVFDDVQGDNDTSFVQWYVDNTTSTNGTNYSSAVTTGNVLQCVVSPYDDEHWGIDVASEYFVSP